MRRFVLALDLKDDPALIEAYIDHHKQVWPEVLASMRACGILSAEIYHVSTRLVMILHVDGNFSFEDKQRREKDDMRVQEWERLMSVYQQQLPFAKPGEKWVLMEKIFSLGLIVKYLVMHVSYFL